MGGPFPRCPVDGLPPCHSRGPVLAAEGAADVHGTLILGFDSVRGGLKAALTGLPGGEFLTVPPPPPLTSACPWKRGKCV